MRQPIAALTEDPGPYAALRGVLIKIFPPESLGIFIVGFLLCAFAGIPFEDVVIDWFRRSFNWLPPAVPAALALSAVSYLALRILFFYDAVFKTLVVCYILARLLYSGVFINQSRMPLWELLHLPQPLPQFYADGAWKFFLIVYCGWALSVLHGFRSVRASLLRNGAEARDIDMAACFLAAFQTGAILLLGGALMVCYAMPPW